MPLHPEFGLVMRYICFKELVILLVGNRVILSSHVGRARWINCAPTLACPATLCRWTHSVASIRYVRIVSVHCSEVFRRVHIRGISAGELESCGWIQLGCTLQPLILVSPLFQLQKIGIDLGLLNWRFESQGSVETARVRSSKGSLVGVFVYVGSPWGLLCLFVLEESSGGLGCVARFLL